MGFRVVVIKNKSKLDLKMNYLVCRGEVDARVFLPEIETLILESTSISLTTALISELVKNKVKIIFCDEKHNPESEIIPYYASYNCSKKISQQILWNEQIKGSVWREIIKEKIKNQANILLEIEKFEEYEMLKEYEKDVSFNDMTNREGHSAKVYFNAIFGLDFARRESGFYNSALNYGYAILLSAFNREIARLGYLTSLGIWHKNEFNNFNLSSDLMEPFRPLIDKIVINLEENDVEYKLKILSIFEQKVKINDKMQFFDNAIAIYLQSVFDALNNNDIGLIKFYEL